MTPPPSLDTLPDEIIVEVVAQLSDVLLPRHLGRFATTSKRTRRLSAARRGGLKEESTAALDLLLGNAAFRSWAVDLRRFARGIGPPPILVELDGCGLATFDTLGLMLCSDAAAGVRTLSLNRNAGVVVAVVAAAAGGGLKQLECLSLCGYGLGLGHGGGQEFAACLAFCGYGLGLGHGGVQRFAACLANGSLPHLIELDLSCNELDDEGIASLAEALSNKKAPELESLDLQFNDFGDEGVNALMATAKAGRLTKLKNLSMDDNHISAAGVGLFLDVYTGTDALRALQLHVPTW